LLVWPAPLHDPSCSLQPSKSTAPLPSQHGHGHRAFAPDLNRSKCDYTLQLLYMRRVSGHYRLVDGGAQRLHVRRSDRSTG
jgi:hypothetical protein